MLIYKVENQPEDFYYDSKEVAEKVAEQFETNAVEVNVAITKDSTEFKYFKLRGIVTDYVTALNNLAAAVSDG